MVRQKARAGLNRSPAKQPPVTRPTKKPRKGEGSSSQPPPPDFDDTRFQSKRKNDRYANLKKFPFWPERRVVLKEEARKEFGLEINRRHWGVLATPPEFYDPEVVLEFYANAYPEKHERLSRREKVSFVRGIPVPYDRDSIEEYFRTGWDHHDVEDTYHVRIKSCDRPYIDEETALKLCTTGRVRITQPRGKSLNIKRADMTWLARVWSTFIMHNVAPKQHQSDTLMQYCHLIFAILQGEGVDIAQMVSDELSNAVLAKMKERGSVKFPALITALCVNNAVPRVQPSAPIHEPITDEFIKICRREEIAARQQPQPPPAPAPAVEPGVPVTMEHFTHMMTRIQISHDHIFEQNTALMRGQRHQEQVMYDWMQHNRQQHGWLSPLDFERLQQWPGDRPIYPEGGEQHHDADDGAANDSGDDDDDGDGAVPSDEERDAQRDFFD